MEREWLVTIPQLDESDVTFLDFCSEGRRLAAELRAAGADMVVALTHMRSPNDMKLAAEVGGQLGGGGGGLGRGRPTT